MDFFTLFSAKQIALCFKKFNSVQFKDLLISTIRIVYIFSV